MPVVERHAANAATLASSSFVPQPFLPASHPTVFGVDLQVTGAAAADVLSARFHYPPSPVLLANPLLPQTLQLPIRPSDQIR